MKRKAAPLGKLPPHFDFVDAGPCWRCGTHLWLPRTLYDAARKSAAINVYCAYGHAGVFTNEETEYTRVRRERDMLREQLAQCESDRRAGFKAEEIA